MLKPSVLPPWRRATLALLGALVTGCYSGAGLGGGVVLPASQAQDAQAAGALDASHGLFGKKGALGFGHQLTATRNSLVFGTRLEAKRFFYPAPSVRIYPEISLGLFELGHHETERLVGGFASPGLGAGLWWSVASDLALTLDLSADYRVRPWDTSVPSAFLTVGFVNLSPLFQNGQGVH